MTTLSYALWFIDILSSTSTFTGLIASILFFPLAGSIILFFVARFQEASCIRKCREEAANENKRIGNLCKSAIKWFSSLFILSCMINFVIPDYKTMNRIIAIESANYVAQTEEAQQLKDKILKRVNKLLDEE